MSLGAQFNINVGIGNSVSNFNVLGDGLKHITDQLNTLNKNFISYSQQSIDAMKNTTAPVQSVRDGLSKCTDSVLLLTQASLGLQNLNNVLLDSVQPGIKLNSSLADLSAITGVTGNKLKEIEMAARASAKVFGTDASQNVESYKLILSQLDPNIAKNSTALKAMGDSINILSKQMGGNTVAATNVLTTAMNQYGISTEDPIYASKVMAEMMDVMTGAAQKGSAELPQIQSALEQSGMMAKTAGVGFVELNSAIQVLDKAGKKGAEGGVAIRNMLAELSQGAMNSPKTIKMLEANGISVQSLADKSLSFSQRLKLLKPIVNDTAAMTLLFGKENVSAAIALANQTDVMDEYTNSINVQGGAVEYANTVMSSYDERMKRITAKISDYKVSIFNATKAWLPHLQIATKGVVSISQLASGINSVTALYGKLIPKKKEDAVVTAGGGVANGFFAGTMKAIRAATIGATNAVRGFGKSIYNIPVIGWILIAIVGIVTAFKLLWEHSKRFREILFGIWEAAKAVFNNVGLVIMRVWNLVIKPVAAFIWNFYKAVFINIWNIIKTVFGWIVGYFKWVFNVAVSVWSGIWEAAKAAFDWIWNGIVTIGTAIGDFFSGIWNWIKSIFGGVFSFVNEWLINPIKNAFNYLWDIIKGIFSKIMEGLKKIFAPIISLWNKIFSKDGMKDVEVAYKEGEKEGANNYDKDHASEGETTTDPKKQAEEKKQFASLLDNLGSSAGGSALGGGGKGGKSLSSSLGGGSGKPTTIYLTIQKLQDKIEIHTMNMQMGAKQAGQKVVEELLMALQSVTAKAQGT